MRHVSVVKSSAGPVFARLLADPIVGTLVVFALLVTTLASRPANACGGGYVAVDVLYAPAIAGRDGIAVAVWGRDRKGTDSMEARALLPNGVDVTLGDTVALSDGSAAPDIAVGAQSYLAVWSGWSTVRAAIMVIKGSDIEHTEIEWPIVASDREVGSVSVAWDGNEYLVVWTEAQYVTNDYHVDVQAVRVNESGELLDSQPIKIARETDVVASVASSGDGFIVAWGQKRPEYEIDIEAVRIESDGTLGTPVVVGEKGNHDWVGPQIESDQNDYFLVWPSAGQELVGLHLDSAAEAIDAAPVSLGVLGGLDSFSVGADGTGYFAIVSNGQGFRVTDTEVSRPLSLALPRPVGIAFDGTAYVLVGVDFDDYNGYSDIIAKRVDVDGSTVTEPFTVRAHSEGSIGCSIGHGRMAGGANAMFAGLAYLLLRRRQRAPHRRSARPAAGIR